MKTKAFILSWVVIVVSSCNTLNVGLVAYYPFNGNAADESGKGNNGRVNGATLTPDRTGKANSAYYFDGISNFISIPDSKILQITDQITMSVWIKTDYSKQYAGIINKINPVEPCVGYGICNDSQNKLCGKIYWDHAQGIGSVIFSSAKITDNNWHFIAFTYDGAIAKLYLDKELVATQTYTGGIQTNTEPLLIGWDQNTYLGDRYYQGIIDDVRLYNRALTDAEINKLKNVKNKPEKKRLETSNGSK